MPMIPIGGLVPFTTIDFPGKLAAVLFCQGCPWRCGYCHNPHLQPFSPQTGALTWEIALHFLQSRRNLLEAVVFSGGEPSLHAGLPKAMEVVKKLDYKIGLHTAGISPLRLAQVLPLVDWIGMDIKAPFDKYDRVTGKAGSGSKVRESAQLVIQSGVPYELRTTVHPQLIAESDLQEMEQELRSLGAPSCVLQAFRANGCRDQMLIDTATPFSFPQNSSFFLSPKINLAFL